MVSGTVFAFRTRRVWFGGFGEVRLTLWPQLDPSSNGAGPIANTPLVTTRYRRLAFVVTTPSPLPFVHVGIPKPC